MKTENTIIIILIMIIIVATGIFTLGNINLHTDSGNDNSEISYDSSILLIPVAPIKLKNHPK